MIRGVVDFYKLPRALSVPTGDERRRLAAVYRGRGDYAEKCQVNSENIDQYVILRRTGTAYR